MERDLRRRSREVAPVRVRRIIVNMGQKLQPKSGAAIFPGRADRGAISVRQAEKFKKFRKNRLQIADNSIRSGEKSGPSTPRVFGRFAPSARRDDLFGFKALKRRPIRRISRVLSTPRALGRVAPSAQRSRTNQPANADGRLFDRFSEGMSSACSVISLTLRGDFFNPKGPPRRSARRRESHLRIL